MKKKEIKNAGWVMQGQLNILIPSNRLPIKHLPIPVSESRGSDLGLIVAGAVIGSIIGSSK